MPIKLKKGNNKSPSGGTDLKISQQLVVQLRWQHTIVEEQIVDCDAVAFLLTKDGVVRGIQDFIFYNQLQHLSGSVIHFGDDLGTSSNCESREEINILVSKIPESISRIAFAVSIANAQINALKFSDIIGASIRIYDHSIDEELAFLNLSEYNGSETIILFGELTQEKDDWIFVPINRGIAGGIDSICQQYGVAIG